MRTASISKAPFSPVRTRQLVAQQYSEDGLWMWNGAEWVPTEGQEQPAGYGQTGYDQTSQSQWDESASGASGEPSIADLAAQAIDQMMSILQEGVQPPPSMMQLKQSLNDGDEHAMKTNIYLLLVDQSLDYDTVEEGDLVSMVPTTVDYYNTEDPRVKDKMRYVYSYGISMFKRGMIDGEHLKSIVLEKLAGRIGMDGPTFDQYLEMPAAV